MLNQITNLHDRPLRYLANVLHETILTIFQLLLMSLLLLGIGGFVFKAIGTDGWLPGLLQRAWHSDPVYALFVTGALVLGGVWLQRVQDQRPGKLNRAGDMLIYGCLALGVFFSMRLIITGSL